MEDNKTQKAVKSIIQVLAENECTASEADVIFTHVRWFLTEHRITREFSEKVEQLDGFKALV